MSPNFNENLTFKPILVRMNKRCSHMIGIVLIRKNCLNCFILKSTSKASLTQGIVISSFLYFSVLSEQFYSGLIYDLKISLCTFQSRRYFII